MGHTATHFMQLQMRIMKITPTGMKTRVASNISKEVAAGRENRLVEIVHFRFRNKALENIHCKSVFPVILGQADEEQPNSRARACSFLINLASSPPTPSNAPYSCPLGASTSSGKGVGIHEALT